MLDNIIRLAVQQKLLVWLFVCALIGCGVFSFSRLSVDAVPDITNNQVQIVTNSSNLACQEVEQFITAPLEKALATLPQKVEIRSISRFGLSSITVVFEEEVNIDLARRWVEERLKSVVDADIIPAHFGRPELAPVTTGLGEIYQYVLYAVPPYDSIYNPTELRTLQEWLVKRQLANLKGVIEVNSIGGFLKQYEVALYPEKMKALSVSVSEIIAALNANNANAGGAYIEKGNYSYFIRAEGLLADMSDIENIAIKKLGTAPILIKDVAKVRIGANPRMGAVTMSGQKNEVVAGQVLMLKGSSTDEVINRVKTKIEDIKKQLPDGVKLESYLDRSKLVQKTFSTVQTNLIEGGLIVVFMLLLFLGNWRAGLIVASVIPLAMLFAVSMMYIFGISANLMSLGAIDFGLVVDGAVIIVESILHRLQHQHKNQKLSQLQMDELVTDSSVKIRQTAAFGEIIILIVYLPILALVGVEGKMFKPMAQTVGFAIIGALILSLTYVPMVTALFINKYISDKATFADKMVDFITRLYVPMLRFALKLKYIVLLAAFILLSTAIWIFSRMGGEFIPTLEEGDFAIHQILPVGSSLSKSIEVSHELQDILTSNFPEVEKIVTKIGTAEIPTDIMPWEGADIFVSLKDQSLWTSANNREELFAKMEAKLNQFPGVYYEFSQPIQMRFNELMTGVRQDIAIKIYGEDLATLAQLGEKAEGLISNINGVGEIQLERTAGLQQIIIRYKYEKLRQYGFTVEHINQTIQTAFSGAIAGFLFEGEKRFEIAVRLAPEFRQDIQNVSQLYISNDEGIHIPLQELAEIRYEEAPMQISRDDAQRRIVLGINVRNRDVESLVLDIQTKLNNDLKLPTGYYLTYGGQFENLKQAKDRLSIAVPISLLLIVMLLYFTFHSLGQALLIFAAVPMSAIGGVLALWIRDLPFSVSAGVGFIALFGVAVLNGIVLIGALNTLKQETNLSLIERIVAATTLRLRAVLMTAAVASFGFLPMAISNTAGAEVQRPLATVVIGGLVTATLLTMFLLPILYQLYEKSTALLSKSADKL
jgi:heavy metal efflux system protein